MQPDGWDNPSITPLNIDNAVTALEAADTAIETAKDTLQQKRADGRTLTKTHTEGIYNQAVLLATGIHNSDQTKLNEYDIKLPADGLPAVIPVKGVISSIEHDDDGIGFKLKAQRIENANSYEWQKGETTQANQTTLPPPYPFWRTTTKIMLVDDDVVTGTRYFYRFRAVNTAGAGEWSEPVNHVQ